MVRTNVMPVLWVCALAAGATAQTAGPIKHTVVYNEPGRYAGWPANGGIWSWDDEIVVGFTVGHYAENADGKFPIDREKPRVLHQARSTDGGETWAIEVPSFLDGSGEMKAPITLTGPIDFSHPDFSMQFHMVKGSERVSLFTWSYDRCKTWLGPVQLPMFGCTGIRARTDYLVEDAHRMLALLAATDETDHKGRPFVARTTDGGMHWDFVSWIGEQPGERGYAIMPTTVRLADTELYTYIRCRRGSGANETFYMEPYRSMDNGKTWQPESENRIEDTGNPVHMIELQDGSLALTYGYRGEPYSIRARLSSDGGKSWTSDIMLRDDGVAWDLGYPRTVQRADGKIVTCYYFNTAEQPERFIGATIWDPGAK